MALRRRTGPIPAPVLVTGASSGIGEAIVAALVGRGVWTIAAVRRVEDGDRLAVEHGELVDVVRFDVADPASVGRALDPIDRIGAIVNNAGTAVPGPLEYLSIDRFRAQLEVNLIGQLGVIQAALPALRAHGRGARVINVGSVGGRVAGPLLGAYHASKFGLAGLTETLGAELGPDGIAVSLVEPGVVATAIWDRGADGAEEILAAMPPEGLDRYGERIERLRRGARRSARSGMPPAEVAEAVVALLQDPAPPPRRLIGPLARAAGVVDRLPDPIRYRLLARARA